MPVTAPFASTVATGEVVLLQIPDDVVLERVVTDPRHTSGLPVMAATTGNGFTVTVVIELEELIHIF
jgi:hypothetical protein